MLMIIVGRVKRLLLDRSPLSQINLQREALRELFQLFPTFEDRVDSDRHGRSLPATCFGDAARCYLSISNKPFR